MKYTVVLQPRALAQLDEDFARISRSHPQTAVAWLRRFHVALQSLSEFPERCPVAPESEAAGREIRLFLFGKRTTVRRVYFVVHHETVRILSIRHAARSRANPDELVEE